MLTNIEHSNDLAGKSTESQPGRLFYNTGKDKNGVNIWRLLKSLAEAGVVQCISSTEAGKALNAYNDDIIKLNPDTNILNLSIVNTAIGLQRRGFSRLLVAGGEISGAVMHALGAQSLAIGPETDPGVPWTRTLNGPPIALALKSGNFGTPDFFIKAWDRLS